MFASVIAALTLVAPPPLVAAPAAAPPANAPAEPEVIVPFRFTDVEIDDAFWKPALDVNRTVTLRHVWDQSEKTGRIANFRKAGALTKAKMARGGAAAVPVEKHEGYYFNDSDVYKLVEGASAILAKHKDEALDMKLDALVADIVSAQQRDGYINTYVTMVEPDKRWADMPNKHELYCLGHLVEAGVAHWNATGKRSLLDAAKRAVANAGTVFGPGKRTDVCGHPEIELALQKLHEVTGDPADLALANWFLMQRGRADGRPSSGEYDQDHKPIREQTEVVGHAVRAMYLYAAAAVLARQTKDAGLTTALETLWNDLVQRKMYLTGGIGSAAKNEGFTSAFDLPNDDAYAETCAAIGLVLWAHEMNLLTREARYADILELALYNAVRSGVSLSGDRFFYSNPLASDGKPQRVPWYDCACCPPNVLRILARLGDFVAFRSDDTVYVNMYVASTFYTTFRRSSVRVTQITDYPWDGNIRMWVNASKPHTFKLALRVPGWSEGMTIKVNDEPVTPTIERGYAFIEREWTPKDIVDVSIPMPVKVVAANPAVKAQEGRFALQRGPLVYCVEGVDSAEDLRSLVFDPKQPFTLDKRDDLLGGVRTIKGAGSRVDGDKATNVPVTAIPYYAWANRAAGPMLVWLPQDAAHAEQPKPAAPPVLKQ